MSAKEIVVGFDGSAGSAAALRWAAGQSRLSGAPVRVVHTWRQPSAEEYAGGIELRHLTAQNARRDAQAWAAEALGDLATGLSIEVDVIEGEAGPVLVERSRDASLLVVGTREHTGLRRLVSGSISHYCLSHATCPIVAVPGPVTEKVRVRAPSEAAASPGAIL